MQQATHDNTNNLQQTTYNPSPSPVVQYPPPPPRHKPSGGAIRKMYENCRPLSEDTSPKDFAEEIFYQCVEKYQPQKMKRIHDSMIKQPNVLLTQNLENAGFGVSRRSSEMMCRRFKKNDK